MKHTYLIVSLLACLITQAGNAAVPQIKFIGKKEWVVSSDERATVLTVADELLSAKDPGFLTQLDDLELPFPVKESAKVVAVVETASDAQNSEPVEVAPPAKIVYNDASVLKVVGENFAKQVRGTLARGDKNYIQLQGGNLLKTGSSFPVSLPEAENQTYVVKLIEVTSDDYTLSLGDVTLTLTYSDGFTGARKTP